VRRCAAMVSYPGEGGGGCDGSARSEVERTVQQALNRAEELEERLAHITVDREEQEVAWKRRMAATEQRAVAAEQRLAELQDTLSTLRTQRDDAVSAADGAVEQTRRAEREREDMTHEVRVLKNTVTDLHKQALQQQVS
jgi:chromosome segregation ATPase